MYDGSSFKTHRAVHYKRWLFLSFFLAVLSLPCCTGFSPVKESRGYSLVVMCGLLTLVASHLGGFSSWWLLLLQNTGSRAWTSGGVALGACGLSSCGSWVLEHKLSNYGTQAYLFQGIWDLPGSGVEMHWQTNSLSLSYQGSPACLVAQSCPNLCDPIDHSPPGSSVHGILQTKMLEWVAISFCRGSSQPRARTCVSCVSLALQVDSLPAEPSGKPLRVTFTVYKMKKKKIRM